MKNPYLFALHKDCQWIDHIKKSVFLIMHIYIYIYMPGPSCSVNQEEEDFVHLHHSSVLCPRLVLRDSIENTPCSMMVKILTKRKGHDILSNSYHCLSVLVKTCGYCQSTLNVISNQDFANPISPIMPMASLVLIQTDPLFILCLYVLINVTFFLFFLRCRKKKKDKDKKKLEEVATTNNETVIVSRASKTKAEIAFEKAKREKVGFNDKTL